MHVKRGWCAVFLLVALLVCSSFTFAQELTPRQKCENLGGMFYDKGPPGQECCGDDKAMGQDFMMVVNAGTPLVGMCIKTRTKWQWITRGLAGSIYRIEYDTNYKGGEAVFTDNGPRVCGNIVQGAFGVPQRLNHEVLTLRLFENDPFLEPRTVVTGYECVRIASGAYAIVECKGSHAAMSEQSTNPLRVNDPGMNASAMNGVNYWCGTEGLWKVNLDSDQSACTLAGQMRMNTATKTVPIAWTGSRCCGEEPGESYSDPLGNPVRDAKGNYMPPYPVAGCWKAQPIRGTGKDRRYVDDVAKTDPLFEQNGGELLNHSIINVNGTFHACQPPTTIELPAFTPVTIIQPPSTSGPATIPGGAPVPQDRVWKLACGNCPDIRLVSLSFVNNARQVSYYYCDAGTRKQLYLLEDCMDGAVCKNYNPGAYCIKPQPAVQYTYANQNWCGATSPIATGGIWGSASVAESWTRDAANKLVPGIVTVSGTGINVYKCTTPAT